MGAPVIHFEIGATDGERSRRFYADLFGWRITPDPAGYGVVDTGAAGINGGVVQVPAQVRPYVTFYVAVEDLDEALDRAEELGGHRVLAPSAVGDIGSMAMFTDPDGTMIGLFTERGTATV
ncbi:VOC family protein [Pseudonocardia dioxanivorans]|uniref:VOC family protein n=1 Tax=Pseudonocardia dioxanivorans TaxID=240495 RepID=UPI00131A5658|nr:VOC family protein [Pseudonocardia dioxanivorans]